jgi:hypothetical protein
MHPYWKPDEHGRLSDHGHIFMNDRSAISSSTHFNPVTGRRVLRTPPWDLVEGAPHAYAMLADDALRAGNMELAKELIEFAYWSHEISA